MTASFSLVPIFLPRLILLHAMGSSSRRPASGRRARWRERFLPRWRELAPAAAARAPTARCARNAGKLAADGTSAAYAASGRLCRGASEPSGRVARASPCAPTPLDAGRLGSQGELERTASPRAATEEGAPPRQLQKDEGGCWWRIRHRRG
jgi:hypothetical protein